MDNPSMIILGLWLSIGGFVGCFVQIMFASVYEEELSFEIAFWFAKQFYVNNKDTLNPVGLTVIIIVMSLLLLPGYILIFIIACINKIFYKLWEAYKYVFRRRK